jgi:hypothetical protein
MKYWETIADNLKKGGWSLGYVSALIVTGAQSGLPTRTVTTESGSLCTRMNC